MLGSRSLSGFQLAPPSVVFHTPPPTAPAYIVLGSSGRTMKLRVRPPILPGPSGCHVPRAASRAGMGVRSEETCFMLVAQDISRRDDTVTRIAFIGLARILLPSRASKIIHLTRTLRHNSGVQ